MKEILCLIIMLFAAHVQAQQFETVLMNKDSLKIQDMHIINKTNNELSLSDENGKVKIAAKIGDTIFIHSVNFERKQIIVDAQMLSGNIAMILKDRTYELDPILINNRSIFEKEKGVFIPGEHVNEETLKLPNVRKAKWTDQKELYQRMKTLKIPVTAIITTNIEQIYSYFSGDLQRKLDLKKFKQQEVVIHLMKADMGNYFFSDILKLEENEIDPFINFCGQEDLLDLYVANRPFQLADKMLSSINAFNEVKKTSIQEFSNRNPN